MSGFAAVNLLVRQHHIVSREIRTEFIRKTIHILIALVPPLAAVIGKGPTLALLAGGVLFYTYAEIQRGRGKSVRIITRITNAAARDADFAGKIILGPVTLGIGAMVSLLLYPEPAAIIAIYSLAFGDGISSIVGKAVGRVRLPGLQGKTLEGSIACFLVVFFLAFRILHSLSAACAIAVTATAFEAVPVKDLDNIIMPMGSGLAASFFLF
jgi:dolichol kinase